MKSTCMTGIVVVIGLLTALAPRAGAEWLADGVPLSVAPNNQNAPRGVSDGNGGMIVVWNDYRLGFDIYAQRVDALGTPMWTLDGVVVCGDAGTQLQCQVAEDGSGGAIAVWRDGRGLTNDIYAQRIDAAGAPQWTADGIVICSADDQQYTPGIVSDGAGGAIVVWTDRRSGNYDLYAQRVGPGGDVLWTADGVPVCTAAGDQLDYRIVSDGAGGVIVAWEDDRASPPQIYAQRISAWGAAEWTADGVALCSEPSPQTLPQIASDGAGGAIVSWIDVRDVFEDIYAQHVSYLGVLLWDAAGEPVCVTTQYKKEMRLVDDGAGGAIAAWTDARTGSYDVYAQRIDGSGSTLWAADGVPLCTAVQHQFVADVVADGDGGAVVSWVDPRLANRDDIYAQRVDSAGNVLWTADGVPLTNAPDYQTPEDIVADGTGGAIVVWSDERAGTNDVYAQLVDGLGRVGRVAPDIRAVRDVPGDQGGWVNVAWSGSPADYHLGEVTEYSVWRALDTAAAKMRLDAGAAVVSAEVIRRDAESPVLRIDLMNGEMDYWELVSTASAYRLQGYSRVVPTLFDSTATAAEPHHFQIIAHTADPGTFWVSEPDSGRSIDDLAPETVQALAGALEYSPSRLVLAWSPNTEADLAGYRVYRGTDPEFPLDPAHLIASVSDTTHVDEGWDQAPDYHYKVAAVDVHDNEGPPALLSPAAVTGVGDRGLPRPVVLAQNHPNPFNPSTTIAFELRSPARVELRVYDAGGRLVDTLLDGAPAQSGRNEVLWRGTDLAGRPVSAGVYFYRLEVDDLVVTRKMSLVR